MRNTPRLEMVSLAAQNKDRDPFAGAVAEATEGEFVSAKFLRLALEKLGYEVKDTPRNVLTRVEVFKGETQIAYGESGDATDALLQAALGYLRELPAVEEKQEAGDLTPAA